MLAVPGWSIDHRELEGFPVEDVPSWIFAVYNRLFFEFLVSLTQSQQRID